MSAIGGATGQRSRERLAAALALLVSVAALFLAFAPPATASDDYPYPGMDPNAVSPMGFNFRNCTDFVAWRLNEHLGTTSAPYAFSWWTFVGSSGDGDAIGWKQDAMSHGFPVDSTPQVGSVAWWGNAPFGHVAIVTAVNGNGSVNVEEYNATVPYGWDARQGLRADAYLHIADTPPPGAPMQLDDLTAVRNADGRLEVFGIKSGVANGQPDVFHSWQTSAGGSWSPWVPLPGYMTTIGAAINGDGRVEVFGANANQPDSENNVYHIWQLTPGGNWSPWIPLPGYMTSVSAATNGDGRLEVFGANAHQPDGQNDVYHIWQLTPGGNWSPWIPLPGYVTSVGATTNADGRLEVAGANAHQPDSQNDVYHIWQLTPGGNWSPWIPLPGYMTSVGSTINADGRLEVAGANAHQPDGQNNVYHIWQLTPGGNWSPWITLSGHLTNVAATANADGRLEIFGADVQQPGGLNNVWHIWQLTPGGSWGGWSAMSG
jgi:surface antigen